MAEAKVDLWGGKFGAVALELVGRPQTAPEGP